MRRVGYVLFDATESKSSASATFGKWIHAQTRELLILVELRRVLS